MTDENTKIAEPKAAPKWVKPFTEYVPLVAFFVVYWKTNDLILATKVIVGVTLLTTALSFIVTRKVAMLPIVTAAILAFFGGLTIFFEDDIFIKMKPTIIQLLFAIVLYVGLLLDRLWVKKMMGSALQMPDAEWRKFTIRMSLFFVLCAVLNEVVWRTQSTDFWVNFKVFGLTGLTFLFFALHIPMFNKYIEVSDDK